MIFLRGLLEAVEAAGVPPSEVLDVAQLDRARLAEPYAWIEEAQFDRAAEVAIELTQDPAFGLHLCELSPMRKFDLFSMITTHAPTCRQALECVVDLQPILWRRPEIDVAEHGKTLAVRHRTRGETELGVRVRTEIAISGIVRLLRSAGAPDHAVTRITFAHRAPSYASEYERVYACPPRFGQPESSVEFDTAWLDQAQAHSNGELFQALKAQAHLVLARIQNSTGHAGRVRDHLRNVLPHMPDMPETARALAYSVRSLRRRLAEEGWSFSDLVQEAQYTRARQLLLQPTRAIKEVGLDIGFTTTAAFDRAFRRWSGESPSEFRSARLSATLAGAQAAAP